MESFLDQYQRIRLYVSVFGTILFAALALTGWWQSDSPALNLLALGVMAGHSIWCRVRHVRSPKAMLLIDSTLAAVSMLTISDHPSTMSGTLAFLALVVVLFSEGRWMVGLLAYLTASYVIATLIGMGISLETVGVTIASLFSLGAIVVVMIGIRRWLGRLDADRSQMVGMVSHELRNNLTGVLGLTDVVGTMVDLEPAEARELIAMAHQQAIDANDIVEDLLTTSRMEGASLITSAVLVDVNAEVVATARRFQGTGTEVGLSLAPDLPPSWADPLRVRQTVRNLLSNALRYGGPEITVATRESGDTIQITVSDNGDGVPTEDESSIFLPYQRSTQGRRDAASIGLGLWICRQLAETMGGHLDYQRRDGLTEFVLTLPTPDPETHPASVALYAPKRSVTPVQPGVTRIVALPAIP